MDEKTDSAVTAAETQLNIYANYGKFLRRDDAAAICATLAALRQQLTDAQRDSQTLERTHRAIPDEFCLDPPDGGDVKPWEAAERMAEALAEARADNAKKDAALRKALNYIENTESELGITLDCGDAIRAALAPAAQGGMKTLDKTPHRELRANHVAALRAAFRVNMLRALPDKSHAEIDAEIDAALAPAPSAGETGDNQDGRAEPVDNLLERRAGDSSGSARIAAAAQPVAPAPSAGETRAAIIEQCAKVAEAYDCHPDEIHGHSIADNIRTLAAAPTTGETP